MANILIKTTGRLIRSVHTPDYQGDDYIINPTEQEIEDNQPVITAEMQALNELLQTDIEVPRIIEDIYDVLTDEQKEALAPETKNKILDKKTKRQNYLDLLK
jgi:hypothetical protein